MSNEVQPVNLQEARLTARAVLEGWLNDGKDLARAKEELRKALNDPNLKGRRMVTIVKAVATIDLRIMEMNLGAIAAEEKSAKGEAVSETGVITIRNIEETNDGGKA